MQFLDPDRTYDILFAQKIKGQILALLTNALGTHSIFDYEFPICLIDRLVPNPISPWCDNWSGLMFEFLKKLSRTHILDDGFLNGSAYGFDPPYQANLPQSIDLSAYLVDSLTVVIPANSEGVLTWQERDHEPQSAPYCDKLTNKLAITRRRGRVFSNRENSPKEITLSCHNWLHNSVCVAGVELSGLSDNQATFLLYENMAAFLDYLWGELVIPDECKVLTGMTPVLTKTFSTPGNPYAYSVQENLAYTLPIFASVPDVFCYAYFLPVGGISEGGKITPIYDGNSLWLEINYIYTYFDYWRATLFYQNPYGYIEYEDPEDDIWNTALSFPILDNPTGASATLATYKNTASRQNTWLPGQLISYPALDRKMRAGIAQNFPFSIDITGENQRDYYWNYTGGGLESINWYQNEFVFLSQNYSFYGEFDLSGPPRKLKTTTGTTITLDPKATAVGLLSEDENLFSSAEIAILQADLQKKQDFVIEEYSIGYGVGTETNNPDDPGVNVLTRLSRHFATVVSVEFQNDLTFSPNIGVNYLHHVTNTISVDNFLFNADESVMQLEPTLDYSAPIEIEVSTPINRTLRTQNNLEYPTLVVLDAGNPNPVFRTVLYQGEPGEAQLQAILYPDGPDGPPLLDPDPDQGDVMPDSLRIKEIHAALDAARFANHPNSTEEEPKINLRTLGRLIEATGRVLGINIDEDGRNIPYPDPVLLDPEKLEEINQKAILTNSQFAIASMGGGLDTSALYEVRSAIAIPGKKGQEEIDLRPHAVKYHNLPQLIDIMAEDTSKQLGGGQNSIYQVPNADRTGYQQYAGVFQGMADALYMLSIHGKAINELQNQAIKSNFLLIQILKGLGLPCQSTKVEGISGAFDKDGNPVTGWMPVPMVDPFGPTLTSLFGIVLMNIQKLVGSTIGYKTDQKSEEELTAGVTVTASNFVVSPGSTVNFSIKRDNTEKAISVGYNLVGTLSGNLLQGIDLGRGIASLEEGQSEVTLTATIKDSELDENKFLRLILEGGEGYQIGKIPVATVAILPKEKEPEDPPEELNEEDWKLQLEEEEKAPDFSTLNQIIQELKNQMSEQ